MIKEIFNVEKIKFIEKYFSFITYDEIIEKENYLIVDLRTGKEFNFKHLKNSIHLPLLRDEISIKLEGMFENRTYFTTAIKSVFYIIPRLSFINKRIKELENDKVVVLACRHARIRSRFIAAFVNARGSKTLVLKDGVNSILKLNKKEILNSI